MLTCLFLIKYSGKYHTCGLNLKDILSQILFNLSNGVMGWLGTTLVENLRLRVLSKGVSTENFVLLTI